MSDPQTHSHDHVHDHAHRHVQPAHAHARAHRQASSDRRTIADRIGMTGSLACAIHCAALPFLFAALPALGLGLLASQGFEIGFVLFASVLGTASLTIGYRRHGRYRAWLFLIPGLLALWAGVFYGPLHHAVVPHAVAMTFGGTLIAIAHLINLRLSHGHVHDAGCHH